MFTKNALACCCLFAISLTALAAPLDDLNLDPPKEEAASPPESTTSTAATDSQRASEAFRQGDIDACLRHLRAIVAQKPSLPPPQLILAGMHLSVGQRAACTQLLEAAASEGSSHPVLYLTFADTALAERRLTDASVHLDKALLVPVPATWTGDEKKWLDESILSRRILIAENRNNWENAQEHLAVLVSHRPTDAPLRQRWARSLFRTNRERKAFEQFDIAFRQNKELNPPEVEIGSLLTREGEFDEAIEWYQKASQAYPRNGRVHVAWSMALLYQGQSEDAAKHAKTARALGVNTPGLDLQQGIIARQSQQFSEAERHLNKVRETAKNHPEATYHLVLTLVAKKTDESKADAMSIARAAYEAYPDSALTNAALGSALFASGNVKDAEAFLRSAIAKQDVQPECIFLLGRLLDYLGKESEARELAAKLKAHMDDVNVFVTRRAAEKWVAQTLN